MEFEKFIPINTRSNPHPKVIFKQAGIIQLNVAATRLIGVTKENEIDVLISGEKIYLKPFGSTFKLRDWSSGKQHDSLCFNCKSLVTKAAEMYDMPLAKDKKKSVQMDVKPIIHEGITYFEIF